MLPDFFFRKRHDHDCVFPFFPFFYSVISGFDRYVWAFEARVRGMERAG
jgi:hypothetical protein